MNPDAIHPYYLIPLDVAGYILGGILVLTHGISLLKGPQVRAFLQKSHRNDLLAQITLAIALGWFFLLVGPKDMGMISSLRFELAEFEPMRVFLQIACPVFLILMITHVKELLFPRALGVLGLLMAAPFLFAAFLKEPESRLLIPIWAYAVVISSLFFIGKPFLYRDIISWMTAKTIRWNIGCLLGLSYGIAVLICAALFWS